jgi:hypothetical protein
MADEQRTDDVTYATATAEQVSQAREDARRKLAELDAKWTPQKWAALRKRLHIDAA